MTRALRAEPAARAALFDLLEQRVRHEVVRCVLRHHATGRDPAQEVDDLEQEVFVALFAADGRALRAWKPDGGRSLQVFVGWFARHQTLAILRSKRRSPWVDDPTDFSDDERPIASPATAEARVADHDLLVRILERLHETATPRMAQLFHLLYVEDLEVEEVCLATGLERGAVYQWRKRLKRRVAQVAEEVLGGPSDEKNDA